MTPSDTLKSRLREFARRRRKEVRFRLENPGRYALDVSGSVVGSAVRGRHEPSLVRLLLVSDDEEETSEEQYNPFSAFRTLLKTNSRVVSAHVLVKDVLAVPRVLLAPFDAFALKLSFRLSKADMQGIVLKIRRIAGTRPVIYFDGDDDICVKHPEILPSVDLYVKKHVFADRQNYLKSFVGKSNLTDYVHRRFGLSFAQDPYAPVTRPVAADQLDKIVVGWNLALDSNILGLYSAVSADPPAAERPVDVMFRGAVPGNWLGYLRQDISPALEQLKASWRVIAPTERVGRREYYAEMMRSKICLSPFGYGEICWRDFEAVLCGCLVIKPDMSHLQTVPDVFQANVTYVPVKWDYADLGEKCLHYLEKPQEGQRIARAAFDVLEGYYVNRGFLDSVSDILHKVGLR